MNTSVILANVTLIKGKVLAMNLLQVAPNVRANPTASWFLPRLFSKAAGSMLPIIPVADPKEDHPQVRAKAPTQMPVLHLNLPLNLAQAPARAKMRF